MQIPHVRMLNIEDLDSIDLLEKQEIDSAWNRNLLKDCLEKSGYSSWGIFLKNQLVAYLIANSILDEVHIMNIAVDISHRRQGFGKALLKHLMESLKNTRFILEVRRDNHPAISLYESCGFIKIGERKNYYQQGKERDALVMSKIIKNP